MLTAVTLMKIRKCIEIEAPGLGAQIKKAREADERSLTQIAFTAGMTAANWYRIEAEETKMLPFETLRKIEQVLGVDFGVKFND
jgi:transcriptional regulator with XRE-family HTH domain